VIASPQIHTPVRTGIPLLLILHEPELSDAAKLSYAAVLIAAKGANRVTATMEEIRRGNQIGPVEFQVGLTELTHFGWIKWAPASNDTWHFQLYREPQRRGGVA
jgi:hypothetical protein